jgi:hypothetical protein
MSLYKSKPLSEQRKKKKGQWMLKPLPDSLRASSKFLLRKSNLTNRRSGNAQKREQAQTHSKAGMRLGLLEGKPRMAI